MRSLFASATMLLLLLLPAGGAQNGLDDECVITVRLNEHAPRVSISYDLLFNDTAWAELIAAVDADGDGNASTAEVDGYEDGSRRSVAGDALPVDRRVSYEVGFDEPLTSGIVGALPHRADVAVDLIGFEGATNHREGKIIRETWHYWIHDPLQGRADFSTQENGRTIRLKWGPAADEEAKHEVAVVETVIVIAAPGWLVDAGETNTRTAEFPSGGGYVIEFVREEPLPAPRDPWSTILSVATFVAAVVAAGALAAIAALVRSRRR